MSVQSTRLCIEDLPRVSSAELEDRRPRRRRERTVESILTRV